MTARVYSDGKRLALGAGATSVHFLADRALFALGDGAVLTADAEGATKRIGAHEGAVLCATLHPDAARLVTGGDDGKLQAISPDGDVEALIDVGGKWIDHVVASEVSSVIVAGVGKQAIVLREGKEAHRFTYPSTVGGLALDAKGRRLAASHYGGVTLRLVLAADDKGNALSWAGSHLALTIAPDGDYIVSAMQENVLHGWRLIDKLDLQMTGYPAKTRSFSWNKNGRWLATSGADTAVIWPFVGKAGPQGKAPLTLGQREAIVTTVAFHPGDDVIALGYSDGAVMLVRLSDQAIVELDEPGEGAVTALSWSADGAFLASGDEAGRGALISMT